MPSSNEILYLGYGSKDAEAFANEGLESDEMKYMASSKDHRRVQPQG